MTVLGRIVVGLLATPLIVLAVVLSFGIGAWFGLLIFLGIIERV